MIEDFYIFGNCNFRLERKKRRGEGGGKEGERLEKERRRIGEGEEKERRRRGEGEEKERSMRGVCEEYERSMRGV